jgi:Skp family chaperone for outer membrane proteins
MKVRTTVILCCVSALCVLGLSYGTGAQQTQLSPITRVGVVSVISVINNCTKNTKHREEMVIERKRIQLELNTLKQEIESDTGMLKTSVPNTDDYTEQYLKLMQKQAALEVKTKFHNQTSAAQEQQWIEQLYKQVLEATQKVAEGLKLDMVLEQTPPKFPMGEQFGMIVNTHKLLYHKGCLDITPHVLAEMDK